MKKIIVEIESDAKLLYPHHVLWSLQDMWPNSIITVKEVKLPDTVDGVAGEMVIGEGEG